MAYRYVLNRIRLRTGGVHSQRTVVEADSKKSSNARVSRPYRLLSSSYRQQRTVVSTAT